MQRRVLGVLVQLVEFDKNGNIYHHVLDSQPSIMETARARTCCDHRKMSDAKEQGLLAVVTLRHRATTLDERPLLVTDGSQPNVHGKLAVVYGHAERLPQTYCFDGISHVMHRCYERSKRACGCVQHVQEFTDTRQ